MRDLFLRMLLGFVLAQITLLFWGVMYTITYLKLPPRMNWPAWRAMSFFAVFVFGMTKLFDKEKL